MLGSKARIRNYDGISLKLNQTKVLKNQFRHNIDELEHIFSKKLDI